MKKGFTLVEMLVVMAVLSILGILILTIFTRTLRGGNKSQIISIIKQNGQAILEIMDKNIRNSDNVVCVNDTTVVVVKDGQYTRFRFTNGALMEDFPVKPDSKLINVFLANICSDPIGTDSLIPPQTLTDTNTQTGVLVQNLPPFFTRDRQPGSKDTVTVKFQLKSGVNAPEVVAGQIDPVNFETTIQLR